MKTYAVRFHIPTSSGHPYVSSSRLVKATDSPDAERRALALLKQDYPTVPPRYFRIDLVIQMTEEPEL